MFERELDAALNHIEATPNAGRIYDQVALDVIFRRVLLPKTKNHVCYAVEVGAVVVLSVWGVGGGVNYAYTHDNLHAARMVYRKRWLIERCFRTG